MSSVYFHFFTDRMSSGDDWTEYLFLMYANLKSYTDKVCRAANCYVFYDTVEIIH